MVDEQTRRLIAYAESTIQEIGNTVKSFNSRNGLDRTGNLLDSLCWGVSYRGQLMGSGFYRQQRATRLSHLHELSSIYDQFPVGGHHIAQNFIKQMGNLSYNGWRLFFGIVAPYWGYWEEGFKFRGRHGSTTFFKFAVMTQFYDTISKDLKPSKMNLTAHALRYTKLDLETVYNKRDTREGKGGRSVYDKYRKKK